jgi:hypothetical protein
VRVLKDLMCDPGLEGTAVDWVIENVCPATGSQQSVGLSLVTAWGPFSRPHAGYMRVACGSMQSHVRACSGLPARCSRPPAT